MGSQFRGAVHHSGGGRQQECEAAGLSIGGKKAEGAAEAAYSVTVSDSFRLGPHPAAHGMVLLTLTVGLPL